MEIRTYDEADIDRAARALHAYFLEKDGSEKWKPDYDENPWIARDWRLAAIAVLEALEVTDG